MEDIEIIELFFERQETAIKATKEKYGLFLNKVAYNILRCIEDAEEIVSDTYLAVWDTIPPAKPDNLKYYLSRITRNLSFHRIDYKNAKKRNAIFVELDDCIPDQKYDIGTICEAKELGRVLNDFLATLDHKTCAIFLARYYYSYSFKELSRMYGLSERQIKYQLEKIRKSLRSTFEKEGIIL